MQTKDAMREMAILDAKRLIAEHAGSSTRKTADDALPDAYFGRFDEANTGLKKRIMLLRRRCTYRIGNKGFFGRHVRTLPGA